MNLAVQNVKTNNRKTSALLSETTNSKSTAQSICCLKATRYVCSRKLDIFAISKFDMFRHRRNEKNSPRITDKKHTH